MTTHAKHKARHKHIDPETVGPPEDEPIRQARSERDHDWWDEISS